MVHGYIQGGGLTINYYLNKKERTIEGTVGEVRDKRPRQDRVIYGQYAMWGTYNDKMTVRE